jgi:predicted DNA-binding protein (MmcQ/YjbR family)
VGGGLSITAALVEEWVTDSYDLALDSAPRSRRPART